MQFKDKKTGKIIEAKNYTQKFAYSHNSNYEVVIAPTVKEIKATLDEKGIPYDKNAKKEVLIALLPKE